jgi:phosphate transport system permease protein
MRFDPSSPRDRNLSLRLARRKRGAALFAMLCRASTWLALLLLVVLLYSVSKNGVAYMWNRAETNPRAVEAMLKADPNFGARAAEASDEFGDHFYGIDPAEFETEDELADARRSQFDDQQAYLCSLRAEDPENFAKLGIDPGGNRFALFLDNVKQFFSHFPSRNPENAGVKSAILGTLWMTLLTALIAIPVGVFAAVYLEEYSRSNKLSRFIEVNIANLAGVPSIVYGLLGLTVFVGFFYRMQQRFPNDERFVNPNNLLCGALTISLLILPVIIIAAREAIKAVPSSLRQAAYAVGATRWQVVSQQVLPAAIPGIVTGVILAMSRAIGETAPLITIGALTYVAFAPDSIYSGFTVLPIQIYNWISRPQAEFHDLAAFGIIVMLAVLLAMNSVAVYLRHRFEKKVKW